MKKLKTLVLFLALVPATAFAQQGEDFTDNFEVRRLNLEKFTIMNGDPSLVNMGTRGLTIVSAGKTPADCNYVYFTPSSEAWEVETDIRLYPTSKGGLVLMADDMNYWGITASYSKISALDCGDAVATISNPYGRNMHLKIEYADGVASLYVAAQKTPWSVVANDNPTVERKPADKWQKLASVTLPEGVKTGKICLAALDKDIVSFRDFWYRVK